MEFLGELLVDLVYRGFIVCSVVGIGICFRFFGVAVDVCFGEYKLCAETAYSGIDTMSEQSTAGTLDRVFVLMSSASFSFTVSSRAAFPPSFPYFLVVRGVLC